MNWKGSERKRFVYSSRSWLQGLTTTARHLSQNRRCLRRYSNWETPQQSSRMLPLHQLSGSSELNVWLDRIFTYSFIHSFMSIHELLSVSILVFPNLFFPFQVHSIHCSVSFLIRKKKKVRLRKSKEERKKKKQFKKQTKFSSWVSWTS
jgi:hypothetical protein